MKKVLALILCLTMMLTLGVSFAEEGEAVYTTLYGSEVSTLNYLIATTQWDQTIPANVIDTLVEYDKHANVSPSLATSWEISPDGITWTFKIREGVKWLDYQGNEVADLTAHDFVSSAKYVLDPVNESSLASQLYLLKNAQPYYEAMVSLASEEAAADAEAPDFADVGVKALDDSTLEYTLESAVPYFLSALTYVNFMPAYGPLLEELGKEFGTSNDKLYYCGAFILAEFEPQTKHTYVKNVANWDAANVKIDRIQRIYNGESLTLAPTMALRGEVDFAELNNDVIDSWRAEYPQYLSYARPGADYSYFYSFAFEPTYDEAWNPANWKVAVNNLNFRRAIMSAFDRTYAMIALAPDGTDELVQNTITPRTFISIDDTDFADLPQFENIEANFFNAEKALEYKAAALSELEGKVTFPVQMVLTYRITDRGWEDEYIILKQQIEAVLGTDFVECVLNACAAEGFLANRRSGNYSFMRCNWGADYLDPETFTDPFGISTDEETGAIVGNGYNKMDLQLTTEDYPETRAIVEAYYALVDEAKLEVTDLRQRYELFAKAEQHLIENAIVVPYFVSPAEQQVTKLNVYEGQFASFGLTILRYKGQTLYPDFISPEQQAEFIATWAAEN